MLSAVGRHELLAGSGPASWRLENGICTVEGSWGPGERILVSLIGAVQLDSTDGCHSLTTTGETNDGEISSRQLR
jgi:hypothetical protein